jgi:CheY-like chemotaxis protein
MKHILICDDSQDILDVTSEILRGAGYHVTALSTCTGIREQAESLLPDLILMDLWMPGRGGENAISDLKRHPGTRHIPVLIFSAVNNAEKEAEKCGADGVIKKPFDIAAFCTIVNYYLFRANSIQ